MNQTRACWLGLLDKTARPVFRNLAEGRLAATMPVEHHPVMDDRELFTRFEALGRSLAGIAPWLSLEGGDLHEQNLRKEYLDWIPAALEHTFTDASPDAVDMRSGKQILVDAAFLCQGFLRGWEALWVPLADELKQRIVSKLLITREHEPPPCNWLLFSAMVEVFLARAGAAGDPGPVEKALICHEDWYKGDGIYGDGADFHWDYYNSFVIQPMLLDILRQPVEISARRGHLLPQVETRARRYAVIQEKMIAPDGTFPAVGRSLTYRFGVFQHLGQMVLEKAELEGLTPAGIRCALTAALKRCMLPEGTFDADGWLRMGLCGHQPDLGEVYISTGSLYLTLCGFLPLGLPAADAFWSDPDEKWTAQKIWSGENLKADHAL